MAVLKSAAGGSGELETYCSSHPDEEVKYFCFECLAAPVCSECVVHGIHKGHDVMHIKKAYPVVHDKLEGVVQGLMSRVEELQSTKTAIQARKAAVVEQSEAAITQIKGMLNELQQRLSKKEKEMELHIETAQNDCLKELETYERMLDEKLDTLLNNVKYVKDHADEGPREALCFYADNNKLLSQALDQEAKAKDQYATFLLSKTTQLDPEMLPAFKEGINNVGEALTRLRALPGPKDKSIDRQVNISHNRLGEYADDYQPSPGH
jgi:hypothetical protein